MDLSKSKVRLKAIEADLSGAPFVVFETFVNNGRTLQVAVTERLRKCARKEGVWGSREMLATLKNAAYGFDEQRARSVGGRDGIFVLDRAFRPPNAMMRKLFDRFLDKPNSGVADLARAMGCHLEQLLPVRLVSHHMRLLGVVSRTPIADLLVLVDCDRSE